MCQVKNSDSLIFFYVQPLMSELLCGIIIKNYISGLFVIYA